jgi:hypothetical protein
MKNALAGLPHGGGKAGIAAPASRPNPSWPGMVGQAEGKLGKRGDLPFRGGSHDVR